MVLIKFENKYLQSLGKSGRILRVVETTSLPEMAGRPEGGTENEKV